MLRLTNTANDFTGTITAVAGALEMAMIPNSSSRIAFNGGTLRYVGAANTTTNRALQIGTAGGSVTAKIESSGVGTIDFTSLGVATRLSKSDAGTWIVTGNSGYTGGTTITSGTLGFGRSTALGTGTVSFSGNATLRATVTGTVAGGVTIANGATLSPGNSPGTLVVTGSAVWGGDGNYNWQLYTTAGGTGTGWDFLDSSGSLDITATGENTFDVNLWSLSALPDTTGSVSDFDPASPSRFLIAEFDGGITGWDRAKFSVTTNAVNGTGGFTNTIEGQGTFTLARGDTVLGGNENQIYLVYAAVPEPGTLALAGIGLAAAGWTARRRVPVRATRRGR